MALLPLQVTASLHRLRCVCTCVRRDFDLRSREGASISVHLIRTLLTTFYATQPALRHTQASSPLDNAPYVSLTFNREECLFFVWNLFRLCQLNEASVVFLVLVECSFPEDMGFSYDSHASLPSLHLSVISCYFLALDHRKISLPVTSPLM